MSNLITSDTSFDNGLLKCIDKSLDIFGESGKKALYWHLESEHGVIIEKLSEDPCRLMEALSKIFGPGAGAIEARLVKEICKGCSRLSLIKTFSDAVNCMKERCPEGRVGIQHLANKE